MELVREALVPGSEACEELFAQYRAPVELVSDMLVVGGWAAVGSLRRVFPEVPFLSVFGRVPVVAWFSRVSAYGYGTPEGDRRWDGGPGCDLYRELTAIVGLRERAVFVPGIYATSGLTIAAGRCYGMPKQVAEMALTTEGDRLRSELPWRGGRSWAEARLLGSGRRLARVLSRFLPWKAWPARFPSGTTVRPLIQAAPRVHVARVRGAIDLREAWLPDPVRLLPLGAYLAGQRMALPEPGGDGTE